MTNKGARSKGRNLVESFYRTSSTRHPRAVQDLTESFATLLEQQGLIKRERTPGGRRERYVVDDELWVRSTLAAVQQNDTLIAASHRAAQILGAATPAGARFSVAAEFLLLVNTPLREFMEQWQQNHADRNARTPLSE
ncbi:hypothetical protein [Nonomuraea zeae]|uniref:MarR family transcriptional regulator n=1 Tax=Nonomuraea zeae TaxID=1642303 RepID=A0A5S4FKT2_9ACTN|nr:hypothetical protein [Nonomuraea zeae]TMR20841.1 hypothetical protein ETD85_51765 [Nonomuraea zeae]